MTAPPPAAIDLSSNDGGSLVRQAIEGLPIALHMVVILVDMEGFSYQDTAAIVRCFQDLVVAPLHRARRCLREELRNLMQLTASNPRKA